MSKEKQELEELRALNEQPEVMGLACQLAQAGYPDGLILLPDHFEFLQSEQGDECIRLSSLGYVYDLL